MVLVCPCYCFCFLSCVDSTTFFSFGERFRPSGRSYTRRIVPAGRRITFRLPVCLPALAREMAVLVSNICTTRRVIPIETRQATCTRITVIIISSYRTELMNCTRAPHIMITPGQLQTCIATQDTFIPFRVRIPRVLPDIVVAYLVFMDRHRIRTLLVRRSNTGLRPPPVIIHGSQGADNGRSCHRCGRLIRVGVLRT